MVVRSGGCQCGEVRYRAEGMRDDAHVCHCRMCQKATGGFFGAFVGVPEGDMNWVRGEAAVFRSSATVERGFCADCGTPLFHRDTTSDHVSIAIATLDRPDEIELRYEAWVTRRLPQMDALGHLPIEAPDQRAAARIRATQRQHPDHETWDDPENYPV